MSHFSLTQKMQGLVRPLIYVVIGYGIGGPQLLGLDHKEVKVRVGLEGHFAARGGTPTGVKIVVPPVPCFVAAPWL